ncbi:hypothetical protein [Autumnicola edwardsiae]|jgi:Na+-transporting methylmalonyl-CoA/oxaloacetate decarboxylase gamma subunit|uniref:Uncharacterized protein n=1 Tax=Autumnicola edwardsiae TaxID=3075594 RepID=A0ABU3CS61_9FLAO|nr:hypothetical protein [Zunongwangia sp. F297]MDT0649194.1 hypothetical protein [Zunongwangia sp. F297]
MFYISFGWGAGFAIIMGLVLLVVIIYTIVKVRKQAHKAEAAEKRKKENPSKRMEK